MTRVPQPAETPEFQLRFRRLGAAFWAMIGFGFFCVLAGLTVARFGPQLFPVRPPAPPPAASSAPTLGKPAPPR